MNASVLFWIALAVLLFWSLGAYNRLVRLRALVISSFGPIDQRLSQALELLNPNAAAPAPGVANGQAPEPDQGRAPPDRSGLHAAAAQLTLSLRIARKQPLDASAMAAFRTAYATMHAVWERHHADADRVASDLARLPDRLAWEDDTKLAREAMDAYNQSVLAYNGAIAQFPAVLLAYLFGFGAAECL